MTRPSGAARARSISEVQSESGSGFRPSRAGSASRARDLSPGKQRGGPRWPAPRSSFDRVSDLPPVALGVGRVLAAALTVRRARARADAGGAVLRDRERVGRLRRRRDGVAGGRDRVDLHLAGAGTDVEAGVGRGRTVRVVAAVVGRARLDLRDHVARVGLRVRVLALLLLAEEGRQSDRGKDADDQDHNEELDERKALLLAVDPLGKLPQHCHSSLEPVVWPDTSAAALSVAARPTPPDEPPAEPRSFASPPHDGFAFAPRP